MKFARSGIAAVLAALVVFIGIWFVVRQVLEDRLIAGARRDLDSIVEFVGLDLRRAAQGSPAVRGVDLLGVAGSDGSFSRAIARVGDQNSRSIYFFDASGRVVRLGDSGTSAVSPSPPAIVGQALQAGLAGTDRREALFVPYADDEARLAVGVWHWLGDQQVGIVAERPHDRFIQPVRWVDGIFAGSLALGLVLAAFLSQVDASQLRRAFRRTDIDACGPYVIKRLLGEGAIANVYLVEDRHLGRFVALKRLKIHSQKDETIARFDREARLASQLNHPNIVTVLDHGRDAEGGFYYTMEFVRGLTLTQWVEQYGPLPPARAVRILRQICAAVDAMHSRNLLHRDIKPDNVMAYSAHGEGDLVKLLDFGLIRDLENTPTRDLTRDAKVLGTPAYMAPERLFDPRLVDVRSDLYGIGCVGFYLLAGRRPFEATRDSDLVQQIRHVPAPTVSSASIFEIPASLDAAIAGALAKQMEDRPASAAALEATLREIEALVPWRAEKARLWWSSVLPS